MKIFSVSIYSKCVPWINHVIHNMKAKKVSLQIIFFIPFLIKIMIFIATKANLALKQLNNIKMIFWKELRTDSNPNTKISNVTEDNVYSISYAICKLQSIFNANQRLVCITLHLYNYCTVCYVIYLFSTKM